MNEYPFPDIYSPAIEAAIKASEVISEIYTEDVEPMIKEDGSPVTKADLAASAIISKILALSSIPILGEELEKDGYDVRSKWSQNWCVDPLDGTRMFLLKNGEFAVNIAHIIEHKAVFGVIADPLQERMLVGGPEYGVYIFSFDQAGTPKKWKELFPQKEANDPLKVICSRSYRIEKHVDELSSHLPNQKCEYIRKGSSLKFFDLALGDADVYPRFAPTMEWDIAAGQAILESLGGSIINISTNKPLTYNKESLFNPHFIAKTGVIT